MGFFDDLGKSITDAGQQVAQKATGMADTARFNSMISEENKKISEWYAEIGRKYYEKHADDENPDSDFSEYIISIKTSKQKVEELDVKIKELKGFRICPECGADVPYDSLFCVSCGKKMPEIVVQNPDQTSDQEDVTTEEKIFCAGCGKQLVIGNKFCTGCGRAVAK